MSDSPRPPEPADKPTGSGCWNCDHEVATITCRCMFCECGRDDEACPEVPAPTPEPGKWPRHLTTDTAEPLPRRVSGEPEGEVTDEADVPRHPDEVLCRHGLAICAAPECYRYQRKPPSASEERIGAGRCAECGKEYCQHMMPSSEDRLKQALKEARWAFVNGGGSHVWDVDEFIRIATPLLESALRAAESALAEMTARADEAERSWAQRYDDAVQPLQRRAHDYIVRAEKAEAEVARLSAALRGMLLSADADWERLPCGGHDWPEACRRARALLAALRSPLPQAAPPETPPTPTHGPDHP